MVCKFTKRFMYMKRAWASSRRAFLWCGMSWGPGAAGGCLTSVTLSLFSELQAYMGLFSDPQINISHNLKDKLKNTSGKSCSP